VGMLPYGLAPDEDTVLSAVNGTKQARIELRRHGRSKGHLFVVMACSVGGMCGVLALLVFFASATTGGNPVSVRVHYESCIVQYKAGTIPLSKRSSYRTHTGLVLRLGIKLCSYCIHSGCSTIPVLHGRKLARYHLHTEVGTGPMLASDEPYWTQTAFHVSVLCILCTVICSCTV
jgi:hypothetical protein